MDNLNQQQVPVYDNVVKKDRSVLILILVSVLFAIIVLGCFFFFGRNNKAQLREITQIDLLPMYGGVQKNSKELQADQDFIDTVIKSGVDKKEAAAGIVNGAWEFAQQGDTQTAMKRFNEAWLLDPNNADIYKGYLSIINPDQFDSLYLYTQKVVEQNPNQATVQCFLGAIRTNMANLTSTSPNQKIDYLNQGEVEFQKGLSIDVNNPFCQLNLAANLYYNGKYQDAWSHLVTNFGLIGSRFDAKLNIEVYEKIKSISLLDEYFMVEMSYSRLGRDNEAFDTTQKAVEKYPKNAILNCDLGSGYINKWYYDPNRNGFYLNQSEKYFKIGLSLDPNAGSCHGGYAVLLSNELKNKEAWKEVHKARSLGWNLFDQTFIKNLEAVFPEPKN